MPEVMSALEKAITELNHVERLAEGQSMLHNVDARAKIVVTLAYVVVVLSFGLESLASIILFWLFPIAMSAMARISYNLVFLKSLYALPFIVFIGMFNPIFDHAPMLNIGNVVVSRGWISFASICVRGLLSVQAVLVLVMSTGFHRVCCGLGALGMPAVFTTQLLLVYRYIFVLLDEAIDMDRARRARSYGRRSYSLGMWGTFIGQLMLRTVARAERIHKAMLSRGFTGVIRLRRHMSWQWSDTVFVAVWLTLFVIGRMIDVGRLFNFNL